jgi:hypothetical protein
MAPTDTRRLGLVLTAVRRVKENGDSADAEYYGYRGRTIVPDGILDAKAALLYVAGSGVPPWNFGSIAISKDVVHEMGGLYRPDVGLCADQEAILRAVAYADGIYIDEPLLDYTVSVGADSHSRTARNLQTADPLTPLAAALFEALRVHEYRRPVSRSERAVVYQAVARSYLRRASQHRYRAGGRGRLGAILDLTRAFRYGPRLLASPNDVAYAIATCVLPRRILLWGRGKLMARRYHRAGGQHRAPRRIMPAQRLRRIPRGTDEAMLSAPLYQRGRQ